MQADAGNPFSGDKGVCVDMSTCALVPMGTYWIVAYGLDGRNGSESGDGDVNIHASISNEERLCISCGFLQGYQKVYLIIG